MAGVSEYRRCSTPRTSRSNSIDVSEVTFDTSCSSFNSLASGSNSSSDSYVSSFEDGFYSITKKGKYWKQIKPQNQSHLYHKIVYAENENDMENIVEDLVDLLNENTNFPITLLQLILDLSDFQHEVLPNDDDQFAVKDIINKIKNFVPQHSKASKFSYIAQVKNKIAAAILNRVFFLFEYMVKIVYQKQLYSSSEFLDFFMLLQHLRLTGTINLIHTATIIAVKTTTYLVYLQKDFHNLQQINNEQLVLIDHYIKLLLNIFEKNCSLNCKQLYIMRCQCIKESKVWMELLPDIYIKAQLEYIKKFITDENHFVRCTTLDIINELMCKSDLEIYFIPQLDVLMKDIAQRLVDTKPIVNTKAAICCTTAINMFKYKMRTNYNRILKNMIFAKDTSFATAACNYYISKLRITTNNDMVQVVNNVIGLLETKLEFLPLFIKRALPNFLLLENFENMFDILKTKNISNNDVYVALILECAIQFIKNKSSMKENCRSEYVIEISNLHSIVLHNLHDFLPFFESNTSCINCVKAIKKYLLIVDKDIISNQPENLEKILKFVQRIYSNTLEENLLKEISEILVLEYNNKLTANTTSQNFIERLTITFNVENELFNAECYKSENILKSICLIYGQIFHIMNKLNLSIYIQWNTLVQKIKLISTNLPNNLIRNILFCPCWYLIMNISESLQRSNAMEDLKEQYSQYISICINMLSDDSFNSVIQVIICECIFTLLIHYYKELGKDRSAEFRLNNSEEILIHNKLFTIIFEIKDVHLDERRKVLKKYLNAIVISQLQSKYLLKTYMYFNQCFEDYGDILTQYFRFLNKENQQEYITVGALQRFYMENIVINPVPIKNILDLVNKFTINLPQKSFKSILDLIIQWIASTKQFMLLDFLDAMISKLSHADCLQLISNVLRIFYNENNNQHVTIFKNKLNGRFNTPIHTRKRNRSRKSSN